MLNSLISLFNNITEKNIIYRDELSKIKPTKNGNNSESKPLIIKGVKTSSNNPRRGSIEEEKGVIRVKVMMTKREANRLLSRCKYGGSLEFSDVAREINDLPVNRITVLDLPSSNCSGSVAVLKTIPEDN